MKKIKKILALALASIMTMAMAAPAFAANYTPVNGDADHGFNKYLVIDSDAKVPDIEFEFSIAPGVAIPASEGTMEVLRGVGTPTIISADDASESNAVFVEGEAASNTVASGDTVVLDEGESYVKREMKFDFSGVSFDEPGIYRYIVTESEVAGRTDIRYDTQKGAQATAKTRYLDVYVTDNDGALEVSSYVLHEEASTISTTALNGSQHSATTVTKYIYDGDEYDSMEAAQAAAEQAGDADPEITTEVTSTPDDLADKSDGFVNEFKTANLEFGKEVEGNQGSKDKYFEFTLVLGNAQPGMTYAVDISQAEAQSGQNSATIAANQQKSNPATITVDENGAATVKYYLKDGQYIKVKGLPVDATYALTENNEDYKPSNGTDKVAVAGSEAVLYTAEDQEVIDGIAQVGDVKVAAVADKLHTDAQSGVIAADDIYTGFTNTRDGVIPTGVALSVLPGILAVLAGGGVAVAVASRKKEEE